MPFTAGRRCAATNLYSLTVVMPVLSGASAPPFICFSSSVEIWSPGRTGPIWPYRQRARPTRPMTTSRTAT
ncbi:MAG: hypothetical protein DMG03_13170 [Acidobacteria bacterium]|nr:MAG: hypothetical protein DMG03_13170 [Acidobacteriota bacterium]